MNKLCILLFVLLSFQLHAQHPGHGNTVVIMDANTPYPEMLLKGMKPGSRVEVMDANLDPLTSIYQIIKRNEPVSSLHILSQGKPGHLVFSTGEIDAHLLFRNEELVGSWKMYFTIHGDILLYGCEVGKGHRGLNFIRDLAVMTGLDIAASDNLTGSVLKGGDWYFEIRSGRIESSMIVSKRVIAEYPVVFRDGTERKGKLVL